MSSGRRRRSVRSGILPKSHAMLPKVARKIPFRLDPTVGKGAIRRVGGRSPPGLEITESRRGSPRDADPRAPRPGLRARGSPSGHIPRGLPPPRVLPSHRGNEERGTPRHPRPRSTGTRRRRRTTGAGLRRARSRDGSRSPATISQNLPLWIPSEIAKAMRASRTEAAPTASPRRSGSASGNSATSARPPTTVSTRTMPAWRSAFFHDTLEAEAV